MSSKLPKIAASGNNQPKGSSSNKKAAPPTAAATSTAAATDAKSKKPAQAGGSLPAISPSNQTGKKGSESAAISAAPHESSVTTPPAADAAAATTGATTTSSDVKDAAQKEAEEKARLESEAAAIKKAADDLAAAEAMAVKLAAEEAEAAARKLRGNGNVILIYEQYNEEFPIVDGSTTHAAIDDVYCLSFVMPNCLIHISKHSPQEKRKIEAEAEEAGRFVDVFIPEQPRGTYHEMEKDTTYYVYVEQEAEQLKRDQARMAAIAKTMDGYKAKGSGDEITRDDGRAMESCSCVYGNPCVDEYGCKDWDNRFAIATKNGWKGF